MLAPVATEIDRNLQDLREKSPEQVRATLELEQNRSMTNDDREKRRAEVLRSAVRFVDMHGWEATITEDDSRLHLSGGSVTIDLGLGASVAQYIASGVQEQ